MPRNAFKHAIAEGRSQIGLWCTLSHHYALVTIFEIMDVAARADLKADVLRDLEKQRTLFNSYRGTMGFGNHVDGAIRVHGPSGRRIRTDISATLFLSAPDDYDGGELLVEDTYGVHSVKLPAGHLILYPASSLHSVRPVTKGARVASFFWIQSMIRDDGQRTLLFDLDTSIQRLNQDLPDHPSALQLTGVYHNLLRRWAEM